jgi:hypothetical protein
MMNNGSSKHLHHPMSLSAEMFGSQDLLHKYKKISGETISTNVPQSMNQSAINLNVMPSGYLNNNLSVGKLSTNNILNRSVLRFDQGLDPEYVMPGNSNYKKPKRLL